MTVTTVGRNTAGEFVVRVAGLPTSVAAGLRCEQTWVQLRQILALRRWLDAEGAALSEMLYGLIGQSAQPELKPGLVALRRAVFTGRRPGSRAWSPAVAQALPGEVAHRIQRWLGELEQREELEAALPEVLQAELAVKTELLRAAVATDAFRYGLVQGSPVLAEQLRKWLEAPPGTVPPRQVVLRLVKYLSRAVAKTSPYATFTALGPGRWSTDGPALRLAEAGVWRSVVDLNGWGTQQLVRALAAGPEFVDRLAVRITPSLWRDGAKLWFFSPGPGEPMCGITASAGVQECLEVVRATPGLTVQALREHLGGLGECASDGQARAFVDRLIAVGLLEPVLPFPDQAAEPLRRLSNWLSAAAPGEESPDMAHLAQSAAWCGALCELDDRLRAYPRLAAVEERVAAHDLIRARLIDLVDSGPEPGSDRPERTGESATLPRKNLTDENAVLTGRVQECGLMPWRAALADLAAVRLLSGLFTRDLPVRLAAAEFVTATFGGCGEVGFLDFYRAVRTVAGSGSDSAVVSGGRQLLAFLGWEQGQSLGESGLQAVQSLDTAQQLPLLRQQTVRLLRGHSADDRGIVTVDPAVVAQAARGWPAWVRTPGSVACHVQALLDGAGPVRLVLNGVATGYGQSRGRVSYLLDRAGRDQATRATAVNGVPSGLVPVDTTVSGADPVLVDVRGLFGSNLNRRPPLTWYELDYPGVASDLPPARLVPLSELMIRFDATDGLLRLFSPQLSREIRPMHLSAMADFLLPPALRLLVAVFGDQVAPVLPSWLLYTDPDPWPPDPWPESEVRVLPRLELGWVTVARAGWYLRAGQLPWRGKGEPDAAYALRLIERLDELGIPQCCYVRVIPEDAWQRGMRYLSKARKPIYLDQANWWSLTVFERTLERPDDRVVFHEALPDLAAAPHYADQGARVTEYVIEVPGSGHE